MMMMTPNSDDYYEKNVLLDRRINNQILGV